MLANGSIRQQLLAAEVWMEFMEAWEPLTTWGFGEGICLPTPSLRIQ